MAKAIDAEEKSDHQQTVLDSLDDTDDITADRAGPLHPEVRQYDRLDQLPTSTKALLENEGERRFFNGLAWYQIFCETCLDTGQTPIFYVVTSDMDDHEQLILPTLTPLGRKGLKLSKEQLGETTCMSMTNYQSVQFGPITNASDGVLATLLESLARHLKDQGHTVLDFNHLDTAIAENVALRPAFERAGFAVYGYPDDKIIVEDIDGRTYADYMKDRSANLRHNIRRKRKRLKEIGQARFTVMDGGPDLGEAIRDYEAVQIASWKPDEVYPDHVPALIRAAAKAGTLRLGLLYLDERPVATALSFILDGTASIKKWHFNNTLREHHVGDLVMSHMVEHLIDTDQATSIDLGKATASHKVKWVKHERSMHGFVAFHPGTLRGQFWRLRFRFEQIVRSQLSMLKRKYLAWHSALQS